MHRRPAAPERPAASEPTRRADPAWFWERLGTGLTDGRSDRWRTALEALRDRRRTHGPLFGEDRIARLAGQWRPHVVRAAARHGLSEALMLAVIAVESGGRATARSPKGAQGLMQLIPATARRFGVSDPYDPAQNIAGGAAYLDWLLRRFGDDALLALAGYNAGEGAVGRHGGVPPYAETRAYVVKVLDALVAAERLCARPLAAPRSRCPGFADG